MLQWAGVDLAQVSVGAKSTRGDVPSVDYRNP